MFAGQSEGLILKRATFFLLGIIGLRQAVWYGYYNLQNRPLDSDVGNVVPHRHAVVRPLTLYHAFNDKRVLCVGCTRGIGRGVALALAEQAASVTVVGRSKAGGAAVVRRMKSHVPTQSFESISYDMSSTRRSIDFVDALKFQDDVGEVVREPYDFVVLTVGAWPSSDDPSNEDGRDRSLALAIHTRYTIIRRLLETGMLRNEQGSRVLSVLASTKADIPPPNLATMKRILSGERLFDNTLWNFVSIMGTEAASHDAMLMGLAKEYPKVSFIGTHPGIVVTNVISPTFPWFIVPFLKLSMMPLARSEESIGWITAQILASTEAGKEITPPKARFFNSMMEGRLGSTLAYDKAFVEWIHKDHLQKEIRRELVRKEKDLEEAREQIKRQEAAKMKKKQNKYFKNRAKVNIRD